MKLKIATLFLLNFICFAAYSLCASGGVSFWPPEGKITANSRIILTFYGDDQDMANKYDSAYRLSLYRDDTKTSVRLIPIEIYKGQFKITQIVFKLEKDLAPGAFYSLSLLNLVKDSDLGFYGGKKLIVKNSFDGSFLDTVVNAHWLCADIDTTPPASSGKPKFLELETIEYGCGPSVYANFQPNFSDANLIAYKVTLTPTDSSAPPVTCYVIHYQYDKNHTEQVNNYTITTTFVPENLLPIGHGMCSGEFVFLANKKYKAHIQAMDASGNVSKQEWEVEF